MGEPRVVRERDPVPAQRLREVHEYGAQFTFVLERGRAKQNLVDPETGRQVELNPRVVFEHPEADGVLPANELPHRIEADVEMIEEQIVVRTVAAVLPTQDVRTRRLGRSRNSGWR